VVALCTDTTWCPAAVDLARDADLLVHEATYAECHADLAVQRKHATASMAAGVAQEAGARQLYLTHFSPRYETGSPVTVDGLLAEARAIFSATDLAEDGLRVPIPARQG
jgi:ribonuclease Z